MSAPLRVGDTPRSVWRAELRWPRPRREDAWALAALAGLVAALFHETVLGGRVLFERDVHIVWISQAEAFVQAVASGAWPVWDRSIAFGQPLLADPSAMVLYPFTWLNLLIRPGTYYTLFVVAHLVFSGLGVHLLGRRLGLGLAGSLGAAGIWTCSGPLLSLVNLWHHFAGAAWIPWVLLAADGAWRDPRTGRALAWGAAMAAQALAGSADMCAMTALVAVAHGALHVRRRPLASAPNRRLVTCAVVAGALAVGLAAAQWLPTLDVARRSARWSLPSEARTFWSVHPLGLLQALLPIPWNELPLRPERRAALYESREPFLASLYLGLAALGLAAAALLGPRRPHRRFLAAVLVGALLVALGRHGVFYGVAVEALPPLKVMRFPAKAMIFAALAGSLLAGMGVEAWTGAGAPRRRLWPMRAALGAAVLCGAAAAVLFGPAADTWAPRLFWSTPETSLSVVLAPVARAALRSTVLALGALVLATWPARRAVAWAAPALAGLAVLDIALAHRGLNPTAPRALLDYRPPAIAAVQADHPSRLYVYEYYFVPGKSVRYLGRESPYVVAAATELPLKVAQALSLRLYPFPPMAGRWGLESSYDTDLRALYPEPLHELTLFLRLVEGTPAHLRLLRMGAVSHVVALHTEGLEDLQPLGVFPSLFPEPVRVFRVPGPLPRAFAVSGVRVADEGKALQALVDPAFDPERELILPEGASSPPDPAFAGEVRVTGLGPDRVALEAELSRPGYVVLVDAYDPGWKARVDGAPALLLRANLAFRAVRVDAGRHRIEQVYRPSSVLAGAAVLATAGLALGGWALAARPRRRAATAPAARA